MGDLFEVIGDSGESTYAGPESNHQVNLDGRQKRFLARILRLVHSVQWHFHRFKPVAHAQNAGGGARAVSVPNVREAVEIVLTG
jgi:hypothetical protein